MTGICRKIIDNSISKKIASIDYENIPWFYVISILITQVIQEIQITLLMKMKMTCVTITIIIFRAPV